MHVLLLTQYYPPEMGGAPNRLSHFVRTLVSLGHTVTVLTALPSYPTGEIFEGYRGRFLMDEQQDRVRIIRTWLYVTKSKSFLRRMLNYCSFAVFSLFAATLKLSGLSCVVVESPPLFLGISGFLISRFKRARFVLNISDLWPEAAVALGMLRHRFLIRIATGLEEFLYRKADLITGQTRGIVSSIRSRCTGKTVALIPNGVDMERFAFVAEGCEVRESIRAELRFSNHFVAGYAGLLGLTQDLDSLIHAAQLVSSLPDILIAFIGDGPEKLRLQKLAAESGLSNVRFVAAQPACRMPDVFSALDVALVPLKRHPLFEGALPSKMFEAMGAGLPVIASLEGEAKLLIEKSQGGICVEPEHPDQVAEAILQLYRNPPLRQFLGENGRQYVKENYNRTASGKKLEQLLVTACEPFRSPLLPETGT